MAEKNIIDAITAPIIKKIAAHAVTALVTALISTAAARGWLPAGTAGDLTNALVSIIGALFGIGQ